jgi:MoaA/NifB/PqqE/SkfB family radical SAM enzyme
MNSVDKYGFGERLTEEFPSQVIVDITERCNLACIHCPHEKFTKTKFYSAQDLEVELNTKLVDEVRNYGQGSTQYIRYSSEGEPLLHAKACEMISYAAKKSGVFVTLTTNGTILNAKAAQSLVESGVHMIDISIDAFKAETYAKIRKNGDLSITNANVIQLLKVAAKKTKVIVSFIEQSENTTEADDFKAYWTDQGADYVVIRKLHSGAGTIGDIADKMRERQSLIQRRPCLYPWERIVLTPRGFLAFCPADWEHSSSITDFRETSIREIWQNPFYKSLRQAHLDNVFSDYPACQQCPDWEMVAWPHEGRSYAELIKEFKKEALK